MMPPTIISLSLDSARSRHLFAVAGASYMIERAYCADVDPIDLPVSAYRAGTGQTQTMTEACCVALVTHATPSGRPLMWAWLDAGTAREVVQGAGIEVRS